ncbi:hypothetical protein OV450_7650 [Actinobacteria bacterium OV450]|nr:hypothetical protein OV450_7650 [Actinobacteria bacterium OV450]
MEAAGHAPAVLSALHALGALLRLGQHRRTGKSGPCGCAPPDADEGVTEVELVMSPGGLGGSDCRAGLGEAAVYDQTAGRR